MAGFASWLFGLPVQQPREYRRLMRIRSRVYTPVARLDAEIIRSAEPIPFDDLDRTAFRPLRPGTHWGKVFDCAWLRITGDVPAGVENPVVMLGIRGEGLAHSPDGELLDSVSTVFQQGDLPQSGGRYRPVRNVDASSGRIEFFADVTYNGWILYEVGRAVYHGAHLATRDDEAYALYYDYLTLLVLAGATEDAALEAELRRALARCLRPLRDGRLAGARAALAEQLSAPSTSEFVYSAVGHGHLDMAWLWPLRETRRKAARTYVRALNTIDRRDDYIYGTSQPQQMAWMKQRHPALYERMRRAVADGRMELQGSFWVEPDTNLPSGESLVRQALVGRRFLQEEFGLTDDQLRLCWLPDTFGYNGNLPQILRGTGMDWFQTIKLAWNKVNDFPHRSFHWQGIDGSTVLVHMPPEGDYNSRGAADNLLTGLKQYPEIALNTALLVYGSGDGGGGPNEIHHEVTQARAEPPRPSEGGVLLGGRLLPCARAARDRPHPRRRALPRDPPGHVHDAGPDQAPQPPRRTQAARGRGPRRARGRRQQARARAALARRAAEPVPRHRPRLVDRARQPRGDRDLRAHRGGARRLRRRARRPPAARGRDAVGAEPHEPAPERVREDGRRLVPGGGGSVCGGRRWWPRTTIPELVSAADTLSNGILTLRFDAASGEIVSCLDRDGAEHAADGLNRLVVHKDPVRLAVQRLGHQGATTWTRRRAMLRVTHVETTVDGPVAVRRQIYRGRNVTIDQRVVLEAGSDVVRFETEVDWHERHRMLRAEFRPAHYGETVRCEIQFGHIERVTTERDSVEKAQFEICAHKWIATEDAGGGFALLNDGKYGHRAKNGLLSLNLLRSPTFPDKTADRGIHRFTYAFCPFENGDLAKVVREGYRLNNPLRITDGVRFDSFAAVDDAGVIIETVKRAEHVDGVVLRLYESLGRPTTTALRVDLPHRAARETDLLERPSGEADLGRLVFRPFEIKTILLED